MSWLNNLKIIYKIGLIIGLLATVAIGDAIVSATRMKIIDQAYTATIENVDMSATMASRAGRRVATYMGSAYRLLTETTAEGNKNVLSVALENRDSYKTIMADVLKKLPEKASVIEPVIAQFAAVFVACQPSLDAAAAANTVEENSRAAIRLRTECDTLIQAGLVAQTKLVDDLISFANQSAKDLNRATSLAITGTAVVLSIGLVLSIIVALFIAIKGLARPIGELKSVMNKFANNDLQHDVPGTSRRDELGEMARTVEIFKTNGLEVARMREEQRELEVFTAAQRKRDMINLADSFESAVGEIINTVSSASTELEASATSLTSVADRSQQIAHVVAAASEEASTNVQSVASATEEMASTVNEIGRQVQESARMANNAVEQARATNDRVGELSEAATRIGAVVELITTIAAQTNLLALNATIEAARAGDSGRGFAVVASEVKALAAQTTKATADIGQQVASIQAATGQSVIDIREIGNTIAKMSEIASTIAAAVEEQDAATQEISRNVQQAAQGTMQVSSNIVDVQRGTSETGSASSQVLSAAQSLSQDSNRLTVEVGRFLGTIRAA